MKEKATCRAAPLPDNRGRTGGARREVDTGTALPEPWMSVLIMVMPFSTRIGGPRSRIEQGLLGIELEGDTQDGRVLGERGGEN